jgi:hypothetical protein
MKLLTGILFFFLVSCGSDSTPAGNGNGDGNNEDLSNEIISMTKYITGKSLHSVAIVQDGTVQRLPQNCSTDDVIYITSMTTVRLEDNEVCDGETDSSSVGTWKLYQKGDKIMFQITAQGESPEEAEVVAYDIIDEQTVTLFYSEMPDFNIVFKIQN